MTHSRKRTKIWLDCDPGRDDAIALLMALHLKEDIEVLGISTVHGNNEVEAMTINTARLLCSFGSPAQIKSIPIYEGAARPLLIEKLWNASVHGKDGLGDIDGLIGADDATVKNIVARAREMNAVMALAEACRALKQNEQLTIVGIGSFTNLGLFVSTFPTLLTSKVSSLVLMGGAEGRGNKSPAAEANVLCDPHAASIVFDAPLPVILCPLNLTHQALFTDDIHQRLLDPKFVPSANLEGESKLPEPTSNLRRALSINLGAYGAAYKKKFGWKGPPLHDPMTIAWIVRPDLFKGNRYRVDVEVSSPHALGATIVDRHDQKSDKVDQDPTNWGRTGKNVFVLEDVDVDGFWDLMLECVDRADEVAVIGQKRMGA